MRPSVCNPEDSMKHFLFALLMENISHTTKINSPRVSSQTESPHARFARANPKERACIVQLLHEGNSIYWLE